MSFAEADGQGELALPPFRSNLAHYGDVAAGGRAELPIHAEVVHQVAPAVAGAHKAAAHARETATGGHGQSPLVLPGQQDLFAGNVRRARRVAGAAVVQMRRQQRIHLEPGQQIGVAFELDVLQNHAVVRVADDLLGQRVAAIGIAVDVANPKSFRIDVFELRLQVALLLVEEGLAVGDQKLHVADLGAVDGGVVDLVQDSMRAGEPHPA